MNQTHARVVFCISLAFSPSHHPRLVQFEKEKLGKWLILLNIFWKQNWEKSHHVLKCQITKSDFFSKDEGVSWIMSWFVNKNISLNDRKVWGMSLIRIIVKFEGEIVSLELLVSLSQLGRSRLRGIGYIQSH